MMKKLRSLSYLILVIALLTTAVHVMAAKPSMTMFNIYAVDVGTGENAFSRDNAGNVVLRAPTHHRIKIRVGEFEPVGADTGVKYKSDDPSIASINSKGVITCKKADWTTITITAKQGDQQRKITIIVDDNSCQWGRYTMREEILFSILEKWSMKTHRVYVKGGKVMADMYVYNGSPSTLKGTMKLFFGYSLWGDSERPLSDYISLGKLPLKFKGKIQHDESGLATIVIPKKYLDPTKVDLCNAYIAWDFAKFGRGAPKGFDLGIDDPNELSRLCVKLQSNL